MKESLIKKFQTLQRIKNDLLRQVNELDQEQLNLPGEKNKWSIAQILFHVHLGEKYSLMYIKKKTTDISQLQSAGFMEWAKSRLLGLMLAMPIKYKAPRTISENIPDKIEWTRLLVDWADTRDELYKFIESLPEDALDVKLFRHPRIGMINMSQTLDFYAAHFNHHQPQVKNHLLRLTAA